MHSLTELTKHASGEKTNGHFVKLASMSIISLIKHLNYLPLQEAGSRSRSGAGAITIPTTALVSLPDGLAAEAAVVLAAEGRSTTVLDPAPDDDAAV